MKDWLSAHVDFSFTKKDVVRFFWAFVLGCAGYLVANPDGTGDWKALLTGAATAGLLAVKNLVLKDGTTLKG